MPQRTAHLLRWDGGFYPTQPKAGGIPNSILDGRNLWIWGAGLLESARGTASAGSSGGANPLMNVGNTHGGVTSGGSVVDAFSTTWAAGSGTALKGGASLGSVSGALRLVSGGVLVNAGILAPSAPTISDSGILGKNNGSYSIALTAIRSTTGAESTRSLPSNVISVTNKKIRVTFPSVPTGADKWGVYCSFRGFGTTGPWFHLVDINTGPATADIEWFNGELGNEAPIDHDIPPTCTHCFAINSCMVAAGTFGGSGLSPSIPGLPEACPPDFTVYIPGGGSITGCKASGAQGAVYISTASSMNAVIGTNNADVSPIMCRQFWPTIGFATGSAWCVVEDEIYGFSGQRGAIRTSGGAAPDTTFAAPVQKFFADNGFTSANTAVSYDPRTDSVIFASGGLAVPFARSRGWWHCPMTISGSAVTSVTVGGQLLLDIGGGSLVSFEGGGGTSWYAIPAFFDFQSPEYNHTIVRFRSSQNTSITVDLLADEDTSTSLQSLTATAPHSDWSHLNLRNKKTFSAKFSGTGSQHSIYEAYFEAIPHRVTR